MALVAFLAVLAVVGAARIAELLVARRRTIAAKERGAAPRKEPAFAVMVLLHVVPFVAAPVEVVVFDRPLLPVLFGACAAGLAVLGALRVWTLKTLGSRWNVRIVKPDAVVVDGPYRYVRHPNYAIVIGELLLLPLVHTAWLTCIVVTVLNAIVLAQRIPAEERMLASLPGYEAMRGKPRFVPRFW